MQQFIESIPTRYYNRLKLHDHFDLADKYDLAGIHLNSRNRTVPTGFQKACQQIMPRYRRATRHRPIRICVPKAPSSTVSQNKDTKHDFPKMNWKILPI